MSYDKSLPYGLIVFCSRNYFKLLGLSALILFAISFHRIFLVIPDPVITKGEVVEEERVKYVSARYHNIELVTQIIEFDYEGKRYRIRGGMDEAGAYVGRTVDVIFSRSAPQNGSELSVEGFLDFPVAKYIFYIWIFLTGGLLAVARLNSQFRILVFDDGQLTLSRIFIIMAVLIALPFISHQFITISGVALVFTVAAFWETKVIDPNEATIFSNLFNFHIHRLTLRNAFLIAILLLMIPVLPHTRLLIMGARTYCIVTDEVIFDKGNNIHDAAIYNVSGIEYKLPINDPDYDKRTMVGTRAPLIYDPNRPENSSLYTFNALYSNNWRIPMGMALILLVAWFFSTRIPDDEGSMDE